jgi:hypothetical protein
MGTSFNVRASGRFDCPQKVVHDAGSLQTPFRGDFFLA